MSNSTKPLKMVASMASSWMAHGCMWAHRVISVAPSGRWPKALPVDAYPDSAICRLASWGELASNTLTDESVGRYPSAN